MGFSEGSWGWDLCVAVFILESKDFVSSMKSEGIEMDFCFLLEEVHKYSHWCNVGYNKYLHIPPSIVIFLPVCSVCYFWRTTDVCFQLQHRFMIVHKVQSVCQVREREEETSEASRQQEVLYTVLCIYFIEKWCYHPGSILYLKSFRYENVSSFKYKIIKSNYSVINWIWQKTLNSLLI